MGKRTRRVSVVLIVLLLCSMVLGTFPQEVSAATKKGTVNASSLYVRKSPSTKGKKVTLKGKDVKLKKGTKVTISKERSGWYYISATYNKKTIKGYVDKTYVTLSRTTSTKVTSATTKFKVPAKTVGTPYIWTSASENAPYYVINKKKVKLAKNQSVTILNEKTVNGKKYYYISYKYSNKTRKGWIDGKNVKLTLSKSVKAKIRVSSVKIRKAAGSKAAYYKLSGKVVTLKKKANVTITKEVVKDNVRYYKISFTYSKKKRSGYVKATDVYFTTTISSATPTATPAPATPAPTPVATPAPSAPSVSEVKPLNDAEFEAMMNTQGFPESYKPALRTLHAKYPLWQFEAFQTGLDWETVISKEAVYAKNTIQSTAYQWIASDTKSYDYVNDKAVVVDGSNWVTASNQAVRYYMDPRNFLDETQIFQFECQSYEKKYQLPSVVQAMVVGTPLAGNFSYTDVNGNALVKSYVDAFMDAADYSSVSPYHLVSRVKQEILRSVNGAYIFSDSVTGTKKGYEGYYNFYNIGAFDSATGSAIENGLKYAQVGGTNAALNASMMIPWNSPYKSIVGGARYLGEAYIMRGQDSVYLQKFNVTSKSTYSHQYMTNVQAPFSESKKLRAAYYGNGTTTNYLNMPIVFRIPVYKNMPAQVAISPNNMDANSKKNFNNWLKEINITWNGTTIISTGMAAPNKFVPATQQQTFTVANEVSSIVLNPTVAGKGATCSIVSSVQGAIQPGTQAKLNQGANTFMITVTAENQSKKIYTLTIVRS